MFEDFWKAYPRKVAKKAARTAWLRLAPSPELANEIIDHVKQRAQDDAQWLKGKEWIPHAATFLNGERWEDEYEVFKEEPVKAGKMDDGELMRRCSDAGIRTHGKSRFELIDALNSKNVVAFGRR